MKRRKFLQWIGIGLAATQVPLPKLEIAPVNAVIGQYSDYVSFSSLTIAESIDPLVAAAATELGARAGQTINDLYLQTF